MAKDTSLNLNKIEKGIINKLEAAEETASKIDELIEEGYDSVNAIGEKAREIQLNVARTMARFSNEKAILETSEEVAAELNKRIEQGHDTSAFIIAIIIASIKDIIDLGLDAGLIGLIPVVGQSIGFFISALLMFFLWGKGWFNETKIKIVWWVVGLFFDNLPLLNALPMNVFLVLWAWHVVRKRGGEAEGDLERLIKKIKKALKGIEKDIEVE